MIRVEDLSLLPSMERDLRQAIGAAMANSLDAQVIGGSGAGANLDGLFNQADNVAIAGAKETFGTAIERFAGVVDGTHANGFADIRALIGVNTFALYASLFANSNKGDISAYDHLKKMLGGLRVSTRVPALDATGQKGIAVLGAQGQSITVPLWRGIELIVDPVHPERKRPENHHRDPASGQSVHPLRHLDGCRGTSQALLSADPDCWASGER